MPGTTMGIQMNLGFPGTYSRNGDCVIAARFVKPTDTANIYFGDSVVLNADSAGGTYSQVAGFVTGGGTFTAPKFGGVAVREVKSFETYIIPSTGQGAGFGFYAPGTPCDVIKRGCVSVICRYGTPTAGGPVYLRTVLDTPTAPNGIVGGFEAAPDGVNSVLLSNVQWFTGVIDGNSVAEIEILSILNA